MGHLVKPDHDLDYGLEKHLCRLSVDLELRRQIIDAGRCVKFGGNAPGLI